MALRLVTGKTGEDVTAAQDAALYAGLAGLETSILPIGEKMRASKISNNSIRVYDGCVIDQGRLYMIDPNTYQNYTIDSGSQGVTRYDIIGLQYTKSGTGDESVSTCVKKNAGKNGTVTKNSLWDGASTTQVGLYRIKLNGLAIESITPMCKTLTNSDNAAWAVAKTTSRGDWTLIYRKIGYKLMQFQLRAVFRGSQPERNTDEVVGYTPIFVKEAFYFPVWMTVTGGMEGIGVGMVNEKHEIRLSTPAFGNDVQYVGFGIASVIDDLDDVDLDETE
jgi:hypothetical protein